jgi:energy-converting hydrogenase Eha subunit B
MFIILALFFASQAVLGLISGGFYGALLVFVAFEMARHGIKTDSYLVTVLIAILALVSSMTVAFIAGLAVAYFIPWVRNRLSRKA